MRSTETIIPSTPENDARVAYLEESRKDRRECGEIGEYLRRLSLSKTRPPEDLMKSVARIRIHMKRETAEKRAELAAKREGRT